jgi:hypothetical protein
MQTVNFSSAVHLVYSFGYSKNNVIKASGKGVENMFRPKYKFTYEEVRIIVLALIELKNQLIEEGRYTDSVDDLLLRLVD